MSLPALSPLGICLGKIEVALAKCPPEIDAAYAAVDGYAAFHGEQEKRPSLAEALVMPLGDTSLSTRTLNHLERAGIRTVGELLQKRSEELLTIPNFAEAALAEVMTMLKQIGIEAKRTS